MAETNNAEEQAGAGASSSSSDGPQKTPMYTAVNAARYHRQEIIKRIEQRGAKLISYVAGIRAPISRDDVIGFMEVLHNIKKGTDLDLMLNTPGGDIDAAEKLISLLHAWVGDDHKLRVIIPDYAKSAGTLMALGANKIIMSDSSELGPIDPQVVLNDGKGNQIPHSVLHYLQAFNTHSATLRTQGQTNDVPAVLMLNKLDPATVNAFQAIRDRTKRIADEQLQKWMFKSKAVPYTKITSDLMDPTQYPSHSQRIGWQEAQQLQLEVEYMDPSTETWRSYWSLYCHQKLAISDKGKLFESAYASYCQESG
jgi:hypothetical protein